MQSINLEVEYAPMNIDAGSGLDTAYPRIILFSGDQLPDPNKRAFLLYLSCNSAN